MNKLKLRKTAGAKSKYESLTGQEEDVDSAIGTGVPTPAAPANLPVKEEDKTEEQKATEAAFIVEQTVNKVSQMATNNLSWANAALLAIALPTTIEINDWNDAGNSWFYFFIIFFVAVLVAFVPRLWEDPEEVARELELNDKTKFEQAKRRASRRYSEDISWVDKDGKKAKKAKEIYSDGIQVNEVLQVVEVEADALGEALEDLVLATAKNVVALALSSAAKDTFEEMVGEDDDSLTTTLYVFYAIAWTIFATVLSFRLGSMFEEFEKQAYVDIIEQGYREAKDEMIAFSLRKRCLKLSLSTTAMVMAWSWRDAFKQLILSMYSGDTDSVAHMWVYCLTATCFVTFINSICKQFYLIVPRTDKVKHLQMGSKGRENLGTMFSTNINFICALAWYDALTDSFDEIGSWEAWEKTLFYWFTAILMQVLSLCLSYFWERYRMQVMVAEKGLAHALVSNFNRFFHHPDSAAAVRAAVDAPNANADLLLASRALSNQAAANVVPPAASSSAADEYQAFTWVLTDEGVKLFALSCGTAASLFVTLSLKYTIAAAYSDVYDFDSSDDVERSDVWAVWVALVVSIIISTLVVQYLGRIVNALKQERKDKEEVEKQVVREKQDQAQRDAVRAAGMGSDALAAQAAAAQAGLAIETGAVEEEEDMKSSEQDSNLGTDAADSNARMDALEEEERKRREQNENLLAPATESGMSEIQLDAGGDDGDAGADDAGDDAGGDDGGDASGDS